MRVPQPSSTLPAAVNRMGAAATVVSAALVAALAAPAAAAPGVPGAPAPVMPAAAQPAAAGAPITGLDLTGLTANRAMSPRTLRLAEPVAAWKAVDLPLGVTLDAATGRLSGAPLAPGRGTAVVMARTQGGEFRTVQQPWTVAEDGPSRPGALHPIASQNFVDDADPFTSAPMDNAFGPSVRSTIAPRLEGWNTSSPTPLATTTTPVTLVNGNGTEVRVGPGVYMPLTDRTRSGTQLVYEGLPSDRIIDFTVRANRYGGVNFGFAGWMIDAHHQIGVGFNGSGVAGAGITYGSLPGSSFSADRKIPWNQDGDTPLRLRMSEDAGGITVTLTNLTTGDVATTRGEGLTGLGWDKMAIMWPVGTVSAGAISDIRVYQDTAADAVRPQRSFAEHTDTTHRIVPQPLGGTFNTGRSTAAAQEVRIPFRVPREATRFALQWSPGVHSADGFTNLDTRGVRVTRATVGVHDGKGGMSRVVAELAPRGGIALDGPQWTSAWANLSLDPDTEYVLALAHANPEGRSLAASQNAGWRVEEDLTSRWRDPATGLAPNTRGVGAPTLLYDTPGDPLVIAMVGDSNTAGVGTPHPFHETAAYVAARRTGAVVVPIGHSGETLREYEAEDVKWREQRDAVGGERFDATIIAAGTNDLLRATPAPALEASMERVGQAARNQLSDAVYAFTVAPAGKAFVDNDITNTDVIRAEFHDYLMGEPEYLDGVVDLFGYLSDPARPGYMPARWDHGDNIHWNAAGHVQASLAIDEVVADLEAKRAGAPAGQQPTRDPEVTRGGESGADGDRRAPTGGAMAFYNDGWGAEATHSAWLADVRAGDEVFAGDWDGDGRDSLGVRRGNHVGLWNGDGSGRPDLEFWYGTPSDEMVVGDWDGDGRDGIGVRRDNAFHLRNTLGSGNAETILAYGRAGDEVFIGDWDGDGGDTFAVRRENRFLVRDELTDGPAQHTLWYGRSGERVVVGDFDGDGRDTVTIHRGNEFHVNNSMVTGHAEHIAHYGRPTDLVVLGDWNADGKDSPLAVRP